LLPATSWLKAALQIPFTGPAPSTRSICLTAG